MRSSSGVLLLFAALVALFGPSRALAAGSGDGGSDGDSPLEAAAPEEGGSTLADASSDDGGGYAGPSLACDGALCDTTTGGTTCGIADGIGRGGSAPLVSAALLLGAFGLGTLRRARAKERRR